jgi:transcriptional regulator with XRE-family HTH domain
MAHMQAIKTPEAPSMGHKDRPLPMPVARVFAALGDNLSRARRRRSLTQRSLAERAGVGLNTLKRMEAGDTGMQVQALARVLHVLGELDQLANLLDTASDDIGLALMDEQLPQRVRAKKTPTAF